MAYPSWARFDAIKGLSRGCAVSIKTVNAAGTKRSAFGVISEVTETKAARKMSDRFERPTGITILTTNAPADVEEEVWILEAHRTHGTVQIDAVVTAMAVSDQAMIRTLGPRALRRATNLYIPNSL